MSFRKILGLVCLVLLYFLSAQLAGADSLELLNRDCTKCHAAKVRLVRTAGGAHASAISCLDCHPQHPPRQGPYITRCTSCHTDHPHYRIDNCLHCHRDPHRPLVTLRDPLKPARQECLSCHAPVGEQMKAEPSRHAELFCNHCHTRHKQIPDCRECHQGHLPAQTEQDCANCHPAHQPSKIIPSGYVPERFCRTCHIPQANDLASTRTLHGGINCSYCHQGRHPQVPQCQKCHGLPHAQAIHSQYRSCLECHGDAHNLNSND